MKLSKGIENDGNGVFIYSGLEGPLRGVRSEQTPVGSEPVSLNNNLHSLFLICCTSVFGMRSRTPSRNSDLPILKETRFLSRPKGNKFKDRMRSGCLC